MKDGKHMMPGGHMMSDKEMKKRKMSPEMMAKRGAIKRRMKKGK